MQYFADLVSGKLTAMNLGWPSVFALLNIAYFGLHYMFASQTAHVGALYTAFLAMMLAAGKASFLKFILFFLPISFVRHRYHLHWPA